MAQDTSEIYFVSEFSSGKPILPAVRTVSQTVFLNLIRQFCSVLQYLHARDYVHLDLHPGNILLLPPSGSNRDWRIKIIDLPPFTLPTLLSMRELIE
ncbi:MAG: hypothetical protein ACE5LU_27440, partial [Anaerolineae bacterium]